MSIKELVQIGWLLTLVLQAVWAVRIWRAGHVRRYPAVFAYLAFSSVSGAITLALWVSQSFIGEYRVSLFGHLIFRPVTWILFFAVVHEMYHALAERYVGLRRVGQLVLYGALGSVAAFLILVTLTDPYSAKELNHYYRLWLIQEQSVYLSTALAVMAIIVVGRFFALPMSRNLRTILGTLGIYFIGMGAMIVLRSFLGSGWNHVLDAGGLALYCLCLAIGNVGLLLRGREGCRRSPSHRFLRTPRNAWLRHQAALKRSTCN